MTEKWTCQVCGFTYDPEKGDYYAHVVPGTPFEDLPSSWRCPVCLSEKEKFAGK